MSDVSNHSRLDLPLLAGTVRVMRRRSRLTTADLAERIGLSQSTITRIEGGEHVPTIPNLLCIVDWLDCPLGDFITRKPLGPQ